MSVSEHEIQLSIGQTLLAAVIGAFGTVSVGFISFFGGRGAVAAQLQGAMTAATKELFDTYRLERAEDHKTINDLRGEVAGLTQHVISLEKILRDHGIEIPRKPITSVVFVQDSKAKKENNHGRIE